MLTGFAIQETTEDAIYRVEITVLDSSTLYIIVASRTPIWRGKQVCDAKEKVENRTIDLDPLCDFPVMKRAEMTYWPELIDGLLAEKIGRYDRIKEAWFTSPEAKGWDNVEPSDGFWW